MNKLSQAACLVLFSVVALISCSSGSLTDEQAIQLFRATEGYPGSGFISVRASSRDRADFQELNRLVEADFLTKTKNGGFAPSLKRKDFFHTFVWNYDHFELVNIYAYALDVTAVRDRRNIDSNTVEMVFELKFHETPEFIEFRKIAPAIVSTRDNINLISPQPQPV